MHFILYIFTGDSESGGECVLTTDIIAQSCRCEQATKRKQAKLSHLCKHRQAESWFSQRHMILTAT